LRTVKARVGSEQSFKKAFPLMKEAPFCSIHYSSTKLTLILNSRKPCPPRCNKLPQLLMRCTLLIIIIKILARLEHRDRQHRVTLSPLVRRVGHASGFIGDDVGLAILVHARLAWNPGSFDSLQGKRAEECRIRTFCAVDRRTSYSPRMASMSSSLGILNNVILFTVFDMAGARASSSTISVCDEEVAFGD
jgi:hypothetical protein